jgi:hypothetical protein
MRLTVILTAVLILLPTLARADDSDGPKKVLFAVSSAGSMSDGVRFGKGQTEKECGSPDGHGSSRARDTGDAERIRIRGGKVSSSVESK